MEITTSPHRPASTPWGRLVALVVILAPVSILALLPSGLGLQRYVISGDSMDSGIGGGIATGTVVFEREVPVGDLRVGDVITYRPPSSYGYDGMVTHRIVEVGPSGILTQGDAERRPDPWVLRPEEPTLPRVAFTLPWVGYAYLFLVHPNTWLLLVGSGVLLALLAASPLIRRRRLAPTLVEEPAGDRELAVPARSPELSGGPE
jgi:signal peptidase I